MDFCPGDVILYPWGVNREPEIVTLHGVFAYPNGSLSIRYRFTSNPRGIDWSGFVEAGDQGVRLLSRGVASVDIHARSFLP